MQQTIKKQLSDLILRRNEFYHIRITKDELTLKASAEIFKNYPYYIISDEGNGQEIANHQHIMIGHNDKALISRDILRELVTTSFKVKGNKEFSITQVKNAKKMASYTVKDGLFEYKGFSQEQIEHFVRHSYQKDQFSKGYDQLQQLLTDRYITPPQYSTMLLDLKAACIQPINQRTHCNHMTGVLINHKYIDSVKYSYQCFRFMGFEDQYHEEDFIPPKNIILDYNKCRIRNQGNTMVDLEDRSPNDSTTDDEEELLSLR